MTDEQYIINRKTNIVELGKILGNISEACCKLGVSLNITMTSKEPLRKKGSKV